MGIGGRNPEFVFGPMVTQSNELEARVGVEVDQVAIRRAVRGPREDTDPAIVVSPHPMEFLFEDRIDSEIAGQCGGGAARGGISECNSRSAEALIAEIAQVTP